MKVHAYYTSEPDSSYTTAYLDDEPFQGSFYAGNLKHGAGEDLVARYEPVRFRWEIVWIQPFDLANYL